MCLQDWIYQDYQVKFTESTWALGKPLWLLLVLDQAKLLFYQACPRAMDAPRWSVLRFSFCSPYWLLTIRMDSDGRSVMYLRLYEMHVYRIVRHHLDCLFWPLWVTMFNLKVLLCKPIRTLLKQNLKHIGKMFSGRSITAILNCYQGNLVHSRTYWQTCERGYQYGSHPCMSIATFMLLSHSNNDTMVQLGYWIVEPLVNRSTEFYPKGGMLQLVRFPYSDNRWI